MSTDPLSLVYHGIAKAMSADEYLHSLHEANKIFLNFMPLPDLPVTANPPIPAKDMPRLSLTPESTTWQSSNSSTGRIDHTVNVKLTGYDTRSVEFYPVVFHLLKITRQLSLLLNAIDYQDRQHPVHSKGGSASYEHDDERLIWTCTIPIELQIYM